MKRCLLIIFFIVSIISCKDDHPDLTSGENKIDLLRAEFEKQTGYDQSQVHLLTPTFRSEVDWSKAIYKGEDTVLVTVRLLDTVIYPINGLEINLKDNVILKAVRNKKLEWRFTTVIFVPTSLTGGYSGLILSRPLSDKAERIRYYNKGSVVNSDEVIRIKFANNKGKSQSGSKLRAGCTYAYVNGILNQVTCTPPEKGEREDDPGFGEPGDYFPPGHGGGSGGGTNSPSAEDKEIIDSLQGYPCAQQILAMLPYLKSDISDLIDQTFNGSIENGFKNLKFSAVNANIIGQKVDGDAGGNILSPTIRLNKYVLENSSQEYIVATMIHEALHAYLNFSKQSLGSEAFQQQFPSVTEYYDANSNRTLYLINQSHSSYGPFVNAIKNAILNYNPQFDPQKAYALALMGVVTRSSMSEQEIRINDQERNRKTNPLGSGTLCDPTKL